MSCPVPRLLGKCNDDMAEVVHMILDDSDGYSGEFAANCLRSLRHMEPAIVGEDVILHRKSKCDCEDPS